MPMPLYVYHSRKDTFTVKCIKMFFSGSSYFVILDFTHGLFSTNPYFFVYWTKINFNAKFAFDMVQ